MSFKKKKNPEKKNLHINLLRKDWLANKLEALSVCQILKAPWETVLKGNTSFAPGFLIIIIICCP